MTIKFCSHKAAVYFLIPATTLLSALLNCLLLLPVAAEQAVLGVVKSDENANQWQGIKTRLQVAGVGYCEIDLSKVSNATDLGNTAVLFLPNIETITPTQAIALNDWMSRGGRVIASGPVGSLSQPGVRQLLRSILGAYWGFDLSTPSQLAPLRTRDEETWLHGSGLSGTVSGGVVIPTGLTSETAATWQLKSNAPAVVTTDQASILGWRWGTDTVASVQLDSAWLRVLLSHYIQVSPITTSSSNCPTSNPVKPTITAQAGEGGTRGARVQSGEPKPRDNWRGQGDKERGQGEAVAGAEERRVSASVALAQPLAKPQALRTGIEQKGSHNSASVASAQQHTTKPQGSTVSPPKSVKLAVSNPAVNSATTPQLVPPNPQQSQPQKLEPTLPGLEGIPQPSQPKSDIQAIALPQELQKLIGRYESANLDANTARLNATELTSAENSTEVASRTGFRPLTPPSTPATTVVAQAQAIAKVLPQLISQQNYIAAQQQWLKAQQLLWNNYPIDRSLAQPEIRAMWLDRATIVRAGSAERLAKIFDQLAAAGINTVFFETVNAGYPIYPSQIAPQPNPLVRGWDPLATAVKLAHSRGMELHAWVWTFAAGNQRHNLLLGQPLNYPGPLITAHPDWASYDNHGSLFPPGQGKPFLDPANPAARRYLLQLFDEIVSRYQVDGLQLDYIRYPFQDPSADRTYGYGTAARQQFQVLAGVDPLQISPQNRDLWEKWTQFRTQQIDSFVAEVSHELRQKHPHLILSVAVYPMTEHERFYKLQQHWEVWAQRGDVDIVVPMAYAPDTYHFENLVQPWVSSVDLGATLFLPGIRLLHLPLSVAFDQIELVRGLPVSGYSLFAVQNLNDELQTLFQNTQGINTTVHNEPIPYRQPFQAALARYQVLERQWNFLLANQQLWLQQPTRSAFSKQAKALEQALNQLATAPSFEHLAMAKSALSSFQSNFQNWMYFHSLEHPYQVKVWSNRLAALETLLRYGERVVLKQNAPAVAQQ